MKSNNRIIKYKLDPKHDEEIQRARDVEAARVIWEKWKRNLQLRRRKIEDIPGLLNDLCAELEKKIQSRDLLENLLHSMIEPKIAEMYGLSIASKFMIELYADCPHNVATDQGMQPCGWGGVISILRAAWHDKAFHLTCPQCGNQLGPDDCAEKAQVDNAVNKGKENK